MIAMINNDIYRSGLYFSENDYFNKKNKVFELHENYSSLNYNKKVSDVFALLESNKMRLDMITTHDNLYPYLPFYESYVKTFVNDLTSTIINGQNNELKLVYF